MRLHLILYDTKKDAISERIVVKLMNAFLMAAQYARVPFSLLHRQPTLYHQTTLYCCYIRNCIFDL